MQIHRRHVLLPPLAFALLGTTASLSSPATTPPWRRNVEAFRQAQVAADAKAFDKLCAAELSYSHSDGRVEDKGALHRQRDQRQVESPVAQNTTTSKPAWSATSRSCASTG